MTVPRVFPQPVNASRGKYWLGSVSGVGDVWRKVTQELSISKLGALAPALRTNQDDAGYALTFHSLHVPPYADRFFRSRQLAVTIPAAA
jgi:hypothetical protein